MIEIGKRELPRYDERIGLVVVEAGREYRDRFFERAGGDEGEDETGGRP